MYTVLYWSRRWHDDVLPGLDRFISRGGNILLADKVTPASKRYKYTFICGFSSYSRVSVSLYPCFLVSWNFYALVVVALHHCILV